MPLPLSPDIVDTDTSGNDNEGAWCLDGVGGWVAKIASCRELDYSVIEQIGGDEGAERS